MLLATAGPVRAEDCTSLGSFEWSGVGTGSWSCGPGTAVDTYRIASGHTVSIASDILLADEIDARIEVLAGGTLETASDRSMTIQLGRSGMHCFPGSNCRLVGRYRGLRDAPATVHDTLEEAGHWRVSEIVPCPGSNSAEERDQPDCARTLAAPGSPSIVRLRWDAPTQPGGPGFALPLDDVLAALVPGRDILCFFDPDPERLGAGAETNFCFDIEAVQAARSPYAIDLRVEQGVLDQIGYPLARRRIAQAQIQEAIAAGSRAVRLPSGTLPTVAFERQAWVGRWLRFAAGAGACPQAANAPCVAAPQAFKISRAIDGGDGDDWVELGDPRGVPTDHPAGTTVWVDYGWAQGDPFFVLAPVRIRGASADESRFPRIELRGSGMVRAVVFEQTRGVRIEGSGIEVWEDVWLQDCVTNTSVCLSITGTEDRIYRRTSITGGSAVPLQDRTHGMNLRETSGITIEDFAIRYNADDCFGLPGGGNDRTTFLRVRCSFTSDSSESCNFLNGNIVDPAPRTTDLLVEDALCEDCTSPHPVFVGMLSTEGRATNVLAWGTTGAIGGSEAFALENLGAIGGTRTGGGSLLPPLVDGFSVRDGVLASANGSLASSSLRSVKNGVISHFVVAGTTGATAPADGVLENIALFDISTTAPCTGSCRLLSLGGGTLTVLRRLLLASTPGSDSGFDLALRAANGTGEGLELDGILVAGWRGPIADHAWSIPTTVMEGATFGGGPCFYDNVSDGTSSVLLNLPPSAVRGVAPGFVGPSDGRFDTSAGSPADLAGCGVRGGAESVGVRGHPWAWRISGLPPERMANDEDGDGVPADPDAPPCASGNGFGCGDVCPTAYDPLQRDTDGDGIGDVCDDLCVGEVTSITEILPSVARIGSMLEIRGTGFGPAARVRLGAEWVEPAPEPGRLLAKVPPLPIGQPVAVQVVNPEGCRSPQRIVFIPEAPVRPACGLIAAELLVLGGFRRFRKSPIAKTSPAAAARSAASAGGR